MLSREREMKRGETAGKQREGHMERRKREMKRLEGG